MENCGQLLPISPFQEAPISNNNTTTTVQALQFHKLLIAIFIQMPNSVKSYASTAELSEVKCGVLRTDCLSLTSLKMTRAEYDALRTARSSWA